MKKHRILISLYVFLLFLVIVTLLAQSIPQEVIVYYFPFGVFCKTFFDLLILVLSLMIFFKANKLCSKFKDRRMAIIAGGFLSAGILLASNLFHSLGYFYIKMILHICIKIVCLK